MISNPLQLLSLLISSIFAFYIAVLMVEFLICCFQVRKYRLRYLLRLLPFIAILFEFFTLGNGIGNWLNPLSCTSCIQKFLLSTFFSDLQSYLNTHQISLVNHLSHNFSYKIGVVLFALFSCTTIFLTLRQLFQIILMNRFILSTIESGKACTQEIRNHSLSLLIDQHRTKIIENQILKTPVATHLNTIIIPTSIVERLSQDEFETVIAHELEHVYWKDPLLKSFCNFMAAFFWWIPTKNWMKKMELDQEMACDQGIFKHHFTGDLFASALFKVANSVKAKELKPLCSFVCHEKKPIIKRITAILNLYPKEQLPIIGLLMVILGITILLSCWLYI